MIKLLRWFNILFIVFVFISCQKQEQKYTFDGFTQGTYYHIIIYSSDTTGIKKGIDSIFSAVDNTFSLWNKNSLLTKLNNNEDVELNSMFVDNFNIAKEISNLTAGALDITVGGVVQAYGFANKNKQELSESLLDSLLQFVGIKNVKIDNNKKLIKTYKETQLDFNAIAQGYTTDMISKFFLKKGVNNFIVDVGGEVYCKGQKPNNKMWSVAIEKPSNNPNAERKYNITINLKDKGIVTSGSYRKFYIENGIKYSHTIDPKTARPVKHSLLSASVIAKDATIADGLATAFMVMGLDKTKEFLLKHKEYAAYLIYSNNKGEMLTWQSDNFNQYVVK